jgi:hypothetical protein
VSEGEELIDNVTQISPLMVWPLASYLAEEMEERGWRATHVAARMNGQYSKNIIVVNLLLAVQRDDMIIDNETIQNIAHAFGVSAQMLSQLHEEWLRWPAARQEFECPEHILDGVIFPANTNGPAHDQG